MASLLSALAMADPIPFILSFPPASIANYSSKEFDRLIRIYVTKLGQVPTATWSHPEGSKKSVLNKLDPAIHSIPYLLALNVQRRDPAQADRIYARCVYFFSVFDPAQMRYVGNDPWSPVLDWVVDYCFRNNVTNLTPISTALLRLDPSGGTFTSYHLDFLRLCTHAQVPSQTLSLLDKNIFAIAQTPPKHVPDELLSEKHALSNAFITPRNGFSSKISPESLLQYYLLGAHTYLGLRNYSRARLFLEYVILFPTHQHAASTLQVEAYKKWILLGLLAEGKTYAHPRTADQQVLKSLKTVSKAYEALADDFEKRDYKKYLAEMDKGYNIWADDRNERMVNEVANALLRYRVIDLQRTYAVLPISRVAAHMEMSEDSTLHLVTDMIQAGHLAASTSAGGTPHPGSAVLRFHHLDAPSAHAHDDALEAQTHRIEDLVTFVRDADRRLQLTKEYVEHQKRAKRAGTGVDGDLADQMDLTWDAPAISAQEGEAPDEDIMAA